MLYRITENEINFTRMKNRLEKEFLNKELNQFDRLKLILEAIKLIPSGVTCIDKIMSITKLKLTDLEYSFIRDTVLNIYTDRKIDTSSYLTYMHDGERDFKEPLKVYDFSLKELDKVGLHYLIEKLTLDGVLGLMLGIYTIIINQER